MVKSNKIDDFVYLGGFVSAENATPDTIGAILSVIQFPFPKRLKKDGIQYFAVVAEDSEDEDLLTYLPQTNEWITECVEHQRPILVHCLAGISRSTTVVCAYIMRKYQMSAERAIDFVLEKRDCISPNDGFIQQLKLFHRMGYTLNANDRAFRNYLNQIYVGINRKNQSLSKYFERLAVASSLTKVVDLGQQYCCNKCLRIAFDEINIIRNIETEDKDNCQDVYIEPKEWMMEQMEVLPFSKNEGDSRDQFNHRKYNN